MPRTSLTRRKLLQSASMALPIAMLQAHLDVATGEQLAPQRPGDEPSTRNITNLRLLGRKLEEQRKFYGEVLGLPIAEDSANKITVQAGRSQIAFVDENPEYENPFYHFCFLIPENKLESARVWLSKRWPLISVKGEHVFHFPDWNAHSIYFLDPGGNIGEFIAHHSLKNARAGEFATDDILHVNEIGVVVDDVSKTVGTMREQLGMGVFVRGSDVFTPVGTAEGSFIVVKKKRLWFPELKSPANVCPTIANIGAPKQADLKLQGFPFGLSVGPSA